MSEEVTPQPHCLVMQPDDGPSYWQPEPANGYVCNRLSPENWPGSVSCGIQVVATHSYVRRHAHDRHREIICVWHGSGKAIVAGQEHKMQPGTMIALPPDLEHTFINDGVEELKFFWILEPYGLENFFRMIGRPRQPGEPAPAPFPRPANVAAIEASTVFKKLDSGS